MELWAIRKMEKLEAENTSLRAECDRLDKQAAMAIALAGEALALSAKVLDENDAMRAALEAAPGHDEIWPGITGAEHFIELALEWHDGERATALGLATDD